MDRIILLMNGITGSGKSYCANGLASKADHIKVIRTSDIRRELGFVKRCDPTPPSHYQKGSIRREKVYAEILKRVVYQDKSGPEVIILDGAYEDKGKRVAIYDLAGNMDLQVFCLYCHCPRPETIKRITARKPDHRTTDEAIDIAILDHIESSFEHPFVDFHLSNAHLYIIDLNTQRMVAGMQRCTGGVNNTFILELLAEIGYSFDLRPRVGLDFDGLIANTYKAKQKYAYNRHGVELTLQQCKRERATEILGDVRYQKMIREIYGTRLTLELEPMHGSVSAIQALDELADCYIVTARYEKEVKWLRIWLDRYVLPIHGIVHTSEKSKLEAITNLGLDWFFDDSIRNLRELDRKSLKLGLYDPSGLDANMQIPEFIARVSKWDDIVCLIENNVAR